jgi:hypothetical protein
MTCTGNATEACGGPGRLNLFWSGTTGPQTNPGIGGWQFSGCYALVESEECIGKEFGADAWNLAKVPRDERCQMVQPQLAARPQ